MYRLDNSIRKRELKLPSALFLLTGGGARLNNFDRLVEAQTKMPVRVAAIDSSLQFKGNNLDKNSNIDILAIAKNATEKFDIDCLSPRPVEVVEEPAVYETPVPPAQHPYVGGRRPRIDEDSLLDDDDDDDAPTRGKIRVGKKTRNYDDDDYQESGSDKGKVIKGLWDRMARFWNDSHEDEEDDIDETVN